MMQLEALRGKGVGGKRVKGSGGPKRAPGRHVGAAHQSRTELGRREASGTSCDCARPARHSVLGAFCPAKSLPACSALLWGSELSGLPGPRLFCYLCLFFVFRGKLSGHRVTGLESSLQVSSAR